MVVVLEEGNCTLCLWTRGGVGGGKDGVVLVGDYTRLRAHGAFLKYHMSAEIGGAVLSTAAERVLCAVVVSKIVAFRTRPLFLRQINPR